MSYFYSGYCPLSARIVGWMLSRTSHWSTRDEALRPLPGPLFWIDPPAVVASDGLTAGRGGEGIAAEVRLLVEVTHISTSVSYYKY